MHINSTLQRLRFGAVSAKEQRHHGKFYNCGGGAVGGMSESVMEDRDDVRYAMAIPDEAKKKKQFYSSSWTEESSKKLPFRGRSISRIYLFMCY